MFYDAEIKIENINIFPKNKKEEEEALTTLISINGCRHMTLLESKMHVQSVKCKPKKS